jgi:two-component system, OmpR family, sensor kinase
VYVLLLALIALGVPLGASLRDRVDSEVRAQARSGADVVAATAAELLETSRRPNLRRLAKVSARSVRGRVVVVDRRGRLIADSAGGAELGSTFADRPEISSALGGHGEQITRHSNTLNTEILATSVPILHGGGTAGAVRVTQSIAAVHRAVRTALLDLALLAGIVLVMGLLVGALIAQQISRPIRRLDSAAQRVASGDLTVRVPVEGSTEQRTLARTFNQMTGRLGRLLRGQQDFVADASHQLKTPLTGLRLRLEGLRDSLAADDPRASDVEAGMREVDRLSQTVDELLVLSRAGERELPGETVNLDDAAERAADRWRSTAAQRRLRLVHAPNESAGSTWCAAPDLDRALDALVENAVAYSPQGTTVTIASAPGRIEVLDEGPGLAGGEEEAVFERFNRGRAGRMGSDGTGLGLPIARELAGEWGGSVRISNRPGAGARAVIEMPPRQPS